MTDKPKQTPAKGMRVLNEPEAPLDTSGELQLDAELAALEAQLLEESQVLAAIALDQDADAVGAVEPSIESKLRRDAQRVASQLGRLPATAPLGRSNPIKPDSSWNTVQVLQNVAALGLIAALAWFAMTSPSTPNSTPVVSDGLAGGANGANGLADSAGANASSHDGTNNVSTPQANGQDQPMAPSVVEDVPWQDLSSPELEGVLDIVSTDVTISI